LEKISSQRSVGTGLGPDAKPYKWKRIKAGVPGAPQDSARDYFVVGDAVWNMLAARRSGMLPSWNRRQTRVARYNWRWSRIKRKTAHSASKAEWKSASRSGWHLARVEAPNVALAKLGAEWLQW